MLASKSVYTVRATKSNCGNGRIIPGRVDVVECTDGNAYSTFKRLAVDFDFSRQLAIRGIPEESIESIVRDARAICRPKV